MGMVEPLLDIEEIRQVKHRHLRCIDLKRWDELGDTLTAEATFHTGMSAFGKPVEITGRPGIVAFLRARRSPGVLTGHSVGHPEIAVDGNQATGIWSQRETVLAIRHRIAIASAGFWEDRYERGEDARWRIAQTWYRQTYEVMMSLVDLPSFKIIAALGGGLREGAVDGMPADPTLPQGQR